LGKTQRYREQLSRLGDWEDFLLGESGLPGPRGNLELLQAVADVGDEDRFLALIAVDLRPDDPSDRREFLVCGGTVGLGRLVAEGREDLLPRLRQLAGHPRWRVREAVAMALQRLGEARLWRLLDVADDWALDSDFLVRRAAAAGVCEPRFLVDPAAAGRVLALLDRLTADLARAAERRDEAFRVLRQALGYCWSVAVVAAPAAGRPLFEGWLASPDTDVRWVLRENLRKKRLERLDPDWVRAAGARLGNG